MPLFRFIHSCIKHIKHGDYRSLPDMLHYLHDDTTRILLFVSESHNWRSRIAPSWRSCRTSLIEPIVHSISRLGCPISLPSPKQTRSSCAISSVCLSSMANETYQDDLRLIQLLLNLHDRIGLLWVLVLCQVLSQSSLQFTLLSRWQSPSSRC